MPMAFTDRRTVPGASGWSVGTIRGAGTRPESDPLGRGTIWKGAGLGEAARGRRRRGRRRTPAETSSPYPSYGGGFEAVEAAVAAERLLPVVPNVI